MAVQVLAINNTVGEQAEFTLTSDTLVWIHGSASGTMVVGIKGSDGKFSPIVTMEAGTLSKSGVLPAGDYRVTRLEGTCGFQRAA